MSSFTAVTAGNPTLATDINQYANALNGTTNAQLNPTNVNTTPPFVANFTAAPSSDSSILGTQVVGDSAYRGAFYVRGADGYGGITGGAGSSYTAHLYAQASGWVTQEAFSVGTNLTVANQTALNGTITSNLTLSPGTANVRSATDPNNQFFGFTILGATDMGIVAKTVPLSFVTGNLGMWFKHNNYYDGSNDRYVTANRAIQVTTATNPGFSLQMRASTDGSPTAGGVISWGALFNLLQASGAAQIFVQGSAPSASQVGDLWVNTSINLG